MIFLFLPAFQIYPLCSGYTRETLGAEHGHPEDSLPAGRRQQGRRSVFRHLVFHDRRHFLLILLFPLFIELLRAPLVPPLPV